MLEDDDQQGLAHFVEHMEFEGTRHFPRQGIVDFLSSLGLSIGPDANAATSYDDTQYTLRVPTDVPGVLDRALLVLEDWAQGATFDQSGIDRERGIVLSEWRMHLGAGERTQDKIRRVQLEGSRYADRPPIGNPDIIEHAQREQLMRFYRDWYRPDLMAVIVVGDVDRDAVAAMIKEHFSSLVVAVARSGRGPRSTCPNIPARATRSSPTRRRRRPPSQISDLRPARNQGSVGGYREIMLDQLFADMLGARLDELSQSANPPFLRAAADRAAVPDAADEGRSGAPGARLERRRDARPRRARHRAAARRAVRLHRDRARPREAGDDARLRARRDGKPRPRVGEPRRRVHAQFPRETKRCRRSGRSSRSTGGSSRASRWPRSTRSPDDWFPDQNRLVVVSAPEAAGVVLPDQAQLAAVVKTALGEAARGLRGCRGGADADGRAARARHDREDDGPSGGRHHRVDAVERRDGRAQADDAEGRSDPVPRGGAGRHVAGERRRFHSRSRRRRRRPPRAASGGSAP